jgi:hypothetical protein
MPRPTDTYTHDQVLLLASSLSLDLQLLSDSTVRENRESNNRWDRPVSSLQAMAGQRQSPYSQEGRILNDEPDLDQTRSPPSQAHLQKCPEYAAWRGAGNGQELAPPNPYNAAGRRLLSDCNKGHVDSSLASTSSPDPAMQRLRSTVDMSKYFDEFANNNLVHKVGLPQQPRGSL